MQVRPTVVVGGGGDFCDFEAGFRSTGYRVTFIADAEAMRLRCESNPPDLLVIDVRDGAAGFAEIAADFERFAKFPILVLRARLQSAQLTAVGNSNGASKRAAYFLDEPFALSELLANMRAILQRSLRREPSRRVEFPTRVIWPTSQQFSVARGLSVRSMT